MTNFRLHRDSVTYILRDRGRSDPEKYQKRLLDNIKDVRLVTQQLPVSLRRHTRTRLFQRYFALLRSLMEQDNLKSARRYYLQAVRYFPANRDPKISAVTMLRLFAHLYLGRRLRIDSLP